MWISATSCSHFLVRERVNLVRPAQVLGGPVGAVLDGRGKVVLWFGPKRCFKLHEDLKQWMVKYIQEVLTQLFIKLVDKMGQHFLDILILAKRVF